MDYVYTFRTLSEDFFDSVVTILLQGFSDDPYFKSLGKGQKNKNYLADVFGRGLRFCYKHGIVYGCFLDESLVGVSLWFDFKRILCEKPEDLQDIFEYSSENDEAFCLNEKIVNRVIGTSYACMYLLSLSVKPKFQRKGIASQMIKNFKDCYSQYDIFTDVSNPSLSKYLIGKMGFSKESSLEECDLLLYRSSLNSAIDHFINEEYIPLAVPDGYDFSVIFPDVIPQKAIASFVNYKKNESPFLIQDINEPNKKVNIIRISGSQLYKWQQVVNPLLSEEVIVKTDKGYALSYVRNANDLRPYLRYKKDFIEQIRNHLEEWDCVTDIYTLIPVEYNPKHGTLKQVNQDNNQTSLIIDSLNFRTKYESGVLIGEQTSNTFYKRIERKLIEIIDLCLYEELSYSMGNKQAPIGQPASAALIFSRDLRTNCGVLHIVLLSCGLFPTQYLDSVSRNQIYVVQKEDGKQTHINIYEYVQEKYGIFKRGKAKNFINVHKSRNALDNALLASMLYGETYYHEGEGLSNVIDPEMVEKTQSYYGEAQYNYASAFFYTNSLIQVYDSFNSVYDRIVNQSLTLFYVEIILFEESAIGIMNHEVEYFLTRIDSYSHHSLIKKINKLYNDNLKTIAFWDITVNYPSSNKSIENIRKAFKIENLRTQLERNKQQLVSVSELRENYLSYWEGRIISILGVFLTVISITEFIIDPSKSKSLIYIGICCLLLWIILLKKLSPHSSKF